MPPTMRRMGINIRARSRLIIATAIGVIQHHRCASSAAAVTPIFRRRPGGRPGSLIQMSMHFPNPYDNWQVTAPGSATGVTCPGQGGVTTQLQGLSDDCSGINDTFIAAMLTAGTAQNASWNAELNQFATGLLDLQNSGVVVILRLFHELNASWFWWGTLTSARQAQLFQYTENYFESQGIHNALYEYCIVDSSYLSGYPGAQYVDLVATDWYGQLAGIKARGRLYGAHSIWQADRVRRK